MFPQTAEIEVAAHLRPPVAAVSDRRTCAEGDGQRPTLRKREKADRSTEDDGLRPTLQRYSVRNASTGLRWLARRAGNKHASNAAKASTATVELSSNGL